MALQEHRRSAREDWGFRTRTEEEIFRMEALTFMELILRKDLAMGGLIAAAHLYINITAIVEGITGRVRTDLDELEKEYEIILRRVKMG